MSEDVVEMDVYPSDIEDIEYLLEREIVREDNYEEIERLFHLKERIEDELYKAQHRQNEKYRRYREEDGQLEKFKKFLIKKEGYTSEKVDELFNDFGIWLLDDD